MVDAIPNFYSSIEIGAVGRRMGKVLHWVPAEK